MRTQFTFYESFASALRRIRKKQDRADAYDAIINYALYGEEPDMDSLPDAAAIAFSLIRPNLDASRRKAENGKHGREGKQTESKPKANRKQTESKPKANRKQEQTVNEKEKEKEKEYEIEIENECYMRARDVAFDLFWAAYPRKVGKQDAKKCFAKVHVPVEQLLSAIEQQKNSDQWTRDNGQYIPNPATWLNQGRWDDELKPSGGERTTADGNIFLQIAREEGIM